MDELVKAAIRCLAEIVFELAVGLTGYFVLRLLSRRKAVHREFDESVILLAGLGCWTVFGGIVGTLIWFTSG